MSFLREVRLIYTREHPVFRTEMSLLRAAITRPGCPHWATAALRDRRRSEVPQGAADANRSG